MNKQAVLQQMIRAIDSELQALSVLKKCPSRGGASHRLINGRMRRLGYLQTDTAKMVGEQTASAVIAQLYAQKVKPENRYTF